MDAQQIRSLEQRRKIIEEAAEFLTINSDDKRFVRTYSINNPRLEIKFNSFYFGTPNYTSRVIIWGPWLYIQAPNVKLPKAVAPIPEEIRREKHLGTLHSRLLLTTPKALSVVREIVKTLKKPVREETSTGGKVRPPRH